jgi:hypothetical protein
MLYTQYKLEKYVQNFFLFFIIDDAFSERV